MPMVQLGRADQHPQRPERQPHVAVNVDGPNPAKGDQAGERRHREAQQESRQVDHRQRVDGIDRMLAVRGQPIEMLGAVMDGVEPPQQRHAMLQAMSPVDAEIAQHHHFNRLQPTTAARPPPGEMRKA